MLDFIFLLLFPLIHFFWNLNTIHFLKSFKMMDFDELLFQVGEFGLYQKALFAFQAPFCIFVTFVLFGQLFMTLYPQTFWCAGHFNCTTGSMTPFQRQNFSFSYTRNFLNPCYINNIDATFISGVVDAINRDGGRCEGACNYTYGIPDPTAPQLQPQTQNPPGPPNPQNFEDRGYRGSYGGWGRGSWSGPNPNPQSYGNNYGGGGRGYYPTRSTTPTPTPKDHDHYPTEDWETAGTEKPTTRRSWGKPSTTTTEGIYWTSEATASTRGGGGGRPGKTTPTSTPRITQSPRTRIPGGNTGNPKNPSSSPGGESAMFSGERDQSCSSLRDITLVNTSRIFFPELNATSVNRKDGGGGSPFVPGDRRPQYLPVERCNNVSWNETQAGVPYQTIVTEGLWYCNAEMYTTAAQAVFFLGAIVGGFLIGFIADTFGRVPALVIANILGAVGGALSVVSTNFWLFMVFRFITGMAFDNCFTMMYILVLEFCGPTYRTLVANLSIAVFYTLGTLILPWLALWVGNWKIYGLIISLPMLLGLLAIFLVPESARWLLSKGRTREATDILRSFAKVNRRKVDERVFVEFENDARKLYEEMQNEGEDASFTAALRTPRLRRTFILLVAIWSLIALVYDGHSRNILNLADENWNVFWMFTIASMTEFPADMMLIFTLDRFGRRWLSFGSLTLSGAFSIIAATIPRGMREVGLAMAIVSRFFVNVAFNIGLQYAAELLPTVIRAQGVNSIHIMGYVASIISPFVAAIGRTNPALSLILLGAFAITAGALSLFLAETLGEDLPNTLEEAEAFGINQSFWNCPICAPPKEEEEEAPIEEQPEIIRRNNIRASIRGEAYRSSIISGGSGSRGSGASRRSKYLGGENIMLNPTAGTNPEGYGGTAQQDKKLRRITH